LAGETTPDEKDSAASRQLHGNLAAGHIRYFFCNNIMPDTILVHARRAAGFCWIAACPVKFQRTAQRI
jgi:hypothetical protein